MSDNPPSPWLTPAQQRIAGFALTLLALLGSAALIIGVFVLLGQLVSYFSGVIWPLATAGVLALILRPVVAVLQRRLHVGRTAAVIILYGVFLLLAASLLVVVVPPLIDQVLDFIAFAPAFWTNVSNYAEQHYPHWVEIARHQFANPAIQKVGEAFLTEGKALLAEAVPTLRTAGGNIIGVFAFTAHIAIVPVYLFFFLLARGEPTKNLASHLSFVSPELRDDFVFLVREFVAIVEAFFRGQLLIGLIMGILLSLGFTLVGLKFGLFIGLALGVLNVVPYLGTILGLAVALPLALFQPGGSWQLVGLVLVVKILVQTLEGWVLTPKIMGSQTGLHPVTIIVAIFFWGAAFGGPLGMLLAIPLTAFVVTAWRLAQQKYFQNSPRPEHAGRSGSS